MILKISHHFSSSIQFGELCPKLSQGVWNPNGIVLKVKGLTLGSKRGSYKVYLAYLVKGRIM